MMHDDDEDEVVSQCVREPKSLVSQGQSRTGKDMPMHSRLEFIVIVRCCSCLFTHIAIR